jgi:S-DNA-T family DNA segregation ATPase FtsK/SpoIIIE
VTTAAHTPQTAEQLPPLTLVKDRPQAAQGVIVEHHGDDARPDWIESGKAIAERAAQVANRLYVPQAARGYRRLARRWLDTHRDHYPQLIRSAQQALRDADGEVAQELKLKQLVDRYRAEYQRHQWIHTAKTAGWTGTAAVGGSVGVVTGSLWVDLLIGAAVYGYGAWHGRTTTVVQGAELQAADCGAPSPPSLNEEALQQALRDIGLPDGARVLTSSVAADGSSTTVVDLPGAVTATALKKKIEALAAALGRDVSMIDVNKAGAEGRVSIWMTDNPPFDTPRPSPLLSMHGGIDAFKDGIPVAWNKRGQHVVLPVNNSSFVIAGMTRSGKGVGAANLIAGAAMDPRINLRIVAGKTNGEWDAYAKAGVAATYFKPNAHRLLALLNALTADMNRRNKSLGEISKSKVTSHTISRVGGIELLVIDELATYTRPGNPLRDDILKALTDLSAVAAGAGILLVLITQYPEVDVIPQALAMNCGTRWAMRVDNATQSNAILGGGASSTGRDASKFDPPLPGLGWLVNPFAAVTDKARSFDLDEDERGEITLLMERAAEIRKAAGRLVGQWHDPIEQALINTTGLSSAAGGPQRNGDPGREAAFLTAEQRQQLEACRGALAAMDQLGRGAAQLDEMAEVIGGGMAADRLGELLRAGGAGGTVKITVPHKQGRVNGYRREDIADALRLLNGS